MSVSWVTPAALFGLALVALPLVIHLLVRQQTRVVAFPSLRFLRETALAAFRRRAIQDAALLCCRMAIIGCAGLALAGPVVQTASRTAGYGGRVSRAIVLLDGAAQAGADESSTAFRFATFRRLTVADALADAVRWLNEQPPSGREIVLTGTFRKGRVERSDLLAVPDEIGLRFVPSSPATAAEAPRLAALTLTDGRLMRVEHTLQLNADVTRASAVNATSVPADRIRVMASARDQPLANAALQAALESGVRWTSNDRRVIVVWDGAADEPQPAPGIEIVRMPVPHPPETAATALWNALNRTISAVDLEPVAIAGDELASWSRPPGPPSATAVPDDEGDRRWLWAAALVLLAAEQWLRRDRTRTVNQTTQEQNVA
jgi:hypothetical protein